MFLTIFEYRQCWNTSNLELCSGCLLLIGIQLCETNGRLQLAGGLLERRGHHLAGPAPWRPEVHHDRNIAATDVCLKAGVRQLHRLARKHQVAAFATAGLVGEACGRYAIYRRAMRANDMGGFRHNKVCRETVLCNFGAT